MLGWWADLGVSLLVRFWGRTSHEEFARSLPKQIGFIVLGLVFLGPEALFRKK